MGNYLSVLGDTDIYIPNNGDNILGKYKDISKGKLILVLFPKRIPKFVLL